MTSRKKAERSPRTTRKAGKADTKIGAASSRKPISLVARTTIDVEPLFDRVVAILEEARSQVVRTVNSAMVLAYWHIGREIVEFVQRGAARAAYASTSPTQTASHPSATPAANSARALCRIVAMTARWSRCGYGSLTSTKLPGFGTSLVPNSSPVRWMMRSGGSRAG